MNDRTGSSGAYDVAQIPAWEQNGFTFAPQQRVYLICRREWIYPEGLPGISHDY